MKVQGGRGFCALSDYVLSFVMTRIYLKRIEKLMKTRNKNLKKVKEKSIFSSMGNISLQVLATFRCSALT